MAAYCPAARRLSRRQWRKPDHGNCACGNRNAVWELAVEALGCPLQPWDDAPPHHPADHQRPAEQRDPQQQFDRSEEHTSELQSLMRISYAVFCLKKKNIQTNIHHNNTYLDNIN